MRRVRCGGVRREIGYDDLAPDTAGCAFLEFAHWRELADNLPCIKARDEICHSASLNHCRLVITNRTFE